MIIDLTQLAAPQAVETLDYEALVADYKADFLARWEVARAADPTLPAYDTLDLETDPIAILIEVVAHREMLLRGRYNDGVKQMLLAFATGANLAHLGAYLGVEKLDGETDDRYRRRIQLRPEALSLAGPEGAYVYHALTAVLALVDATAIRSADGEVTVTLLAGIDAPQPTSAQIQAVRRALEAADVAPLTDTLIVQGPQVVTVDLSVALTLYPGPDGAIVKSAVEAALAALKLAHARLDQDLSLSAIHGRAHQAGVQAVRIVSPAADVPTTRTQYVRIRTITVAVEEERNT